MKKFTVLKLFYFIDNKQKPTNNHYVRLKKNTK